MNGQRADSNYRRLRRLAANLTAEPEQEKIAQRIARRLADSDMEIKTAAQIFNSLHKLPESEFELWIELGTSILKAITGEDDRIQADDRTNEVVDEFATRWVIQAWTKISLNDPNAYQLEQATKAAEEIKAAQYTDTYEAITDIHEVYEAADNITTDQYLRLGYKFIEHTTEPEDRIAWEDCEEYARNLIESQKDK